MKAQSWIKTNFKLKPNNKHLWWLIIPGAIAFFGSIGVLIFSSFYDWEIAVFFGNFFHHPFGNFLAHWASYTGNKMIYFALVPAIMIVIETYFLKVKVFKPQSLLARHQWILFLLYFIFFVTFIGINVSELWKQRFFDYGWGPGINVRFIESYETGLIFKGIFFGINFIFYCGISYFIHYHLARKKILIKHDYWVPSLKILMFSALIYGMVGITKLGMGRPFYFSNIYQYNPDGGKTIIEEMEAAGFGPPVKNLYMQLPYTEWWQPFRSYSHWQELITFDFNKYLYNATFPSGHIASGAILLTLFFYDTDKSKKSPARKMTIVFSYIMFLQLIAVYIGMVIYRFHWMSDMAFTMIFNVVFICFVHMKINFWYTSGFLRKYLPLLSKNDKIKVVVYKTR